MIMVCEDNILIKVFISEIVSSMQTDRDPAKRLI